jgi:DHA3 family multidrug efflux protein-like MFS transporter
MAIWLCLIPAAEAAEQTIRHKLIPLERQGRVFGFAQSVEQAAAPIPAFLIGPLIQLVFIPFMTTGAGVDLIGGWFETGADRGIAPVFIVTGMLRSGAYRRLADRCQTPSLAVAIAVEPAMATWPH